MLLSCTCVCVSGYICPCLELTEICLSQSQCRDYRHEVPYLTRSSFLGEFKEELKSRVGFFSLVAHFLIKGCTFPSFWICCSEHSEIYIYTHTQRTETKAGRVGIRTVTGTQIPPCEIRNRDLQFGSQERLAQIFCSLGKNRASWDLISKVLGEFIALLVHCFLKRKPYSLRKLYFILIKIFSTFYENEADFSMDPETEKERPSRQAEASLSYSCVR